MHQFLQPIVNDGCKKLCDFGRTECDRQPNGETHPLGDAVVEWTQTAVYKTTTLCVSARLSKKPLPSTRNKKTSLCKPPSYFFVRQREKLAYQQLKRHSKKQLLYWHCTV